MLAAWVFGYHICLQLGVENPLAARGYLGVDGFFMLSGMVLALAHPSLGTGRAELIAFWARRLRRIYPVHVATLALLVLLVAAGSVAGLAARDPGRFGARELVLNLLLLHGWGLSARWAWDYPSWSVSTEWFGYLLFPLAWLGVRRLSAPAAAVLAVAAMASLHAVEQGPGTGLNLTYEFPLWRFLPEFAAGMAAARLAPAAGRRIPGRLLFAAGLVWTCVALARADDAWVVPGLLAVLTGLLVASLQGAQPAFARIPGLIAAGELSYAFYMSFAVIETMQAQVWRRLGVTPADTPAAYVLAATLGTLALAALLHVAVERPALGRGRRLARRPASV